MAKPAGASDEFRVVIDLSHAEREAERIAALLASLRKRHDLARFEYTRLVRIQPAGPTHSHPILTLGTRFADTEDLLLSTYLHEQMHWYLWRLGGPDHDPIAPFFDELVRRYPRAPTRLPEGARSYEQTYLHLVVCRLELEATAALIGRERAALITEAPWGYRWIYRTVLADWDALGELLEANGLLPFRTPAELDREDRRRKRVLPRPAAREAPARSKPKPKPKKTVTAAQRKRQSAKTQPPRQQSRRKRPARGGRSAG